MKNFSFRSYVLVFVFSAITGFGLSSFSNAEEGKHQEDIVYGNVICIVPDLKSGNVSPVIANENCNGHKAHAHVIVDTRSREGNVYGVQGSPEAISRLQALKNKENVAVKGKISGDQKAWIITVE